MALIGPSLELGLAPAPEREAATRFTDDRGDDDGWARYNAHSWRRDYRGFAEFFFSRVFTEPHSTKQIEDCVGWACDTDAETLIAAEVAGLDEARTARLCAQVQCPVLVVHGDEDAIVPHAVGSRAAELTGGRLLTFEGSGHGIPARDPVRLDLALREFVDPATSQPTSRWPRAQLHVHHRLVRHRAGRRMDYEQSSPDVIAQTIAEEIGRDVDYVPVPTDGAQRAARIIAELL